MLRLGSLPPDEETHEIGLANRANFGAKPLDRVSMNARQKATIAPFLRRLSIEDVDIAIARTRFIIEGRVRTSA